MIWLGVTIVIVTLVQLYLWVWQLDAVNRHTFSLKEEETTHDLPQVSLIIAVKNEAANLSQNLTNWLHQDYPHLEIIIIDDHSTDETWQILSSYSSDRLSIYQLPSSHKGKKAAIDHGISKSSDEWIVTTDADCEPSTKQWITGLMSAAEDADMILGYSPYKRADNWVGTLVSYESWYVALQYISALLLGRPYMSVGRNVAFRRSLFDGVDGFSSHQDLLSGPCPSERDLGVDVRPRKLECIHPTEEKTYLYSTKI